MRPSQTRAVLMSHTGLYNTALAIRMCTDTIELMDTWPGDDYFGPKDEGIVRKKILKQVIVGYQTNPDPLDPAHDSTLEHAVYTFRLWFSRAVLQELSRHRISSPSVQSTRYTLRRILTRGGDLSQHLTRTGDPEIDDQNTKQLEVLIEQVEQGKPNDVTKYLVPEAFRTQEILTINARSLRNLFRLRTSSHALWEIRQLAYGMFDAIPDGHKLFFEDMVHPNRPEWCWDGE